MAGMGPAPKDPGSRRRRNASVALTRLPAEGRKGAPPAWPLPPLAGEKTSSARHKLELRIWRDLWATPMAVMWQRQRWVRDVAQYARGKSMAELGDLDREKEARLLGDRLGLTPMAMLRLRWEVVADELAERRGERTSAADTPAPPLYLAVDPDAAAGG